MPKRNHYWIVRDSSDGSVIHGPFDTKNEAKDYNNKVLAKLQHIPPDKLKPWEIVKLVPA